MPSRLAAQLAAQHASQLDANPLNLSGDEHAALPRPRLHDRVHRQQVRQGEGIP